MCSIALGEFLNFRLYFFISCYFTLLTSAFVIMFEKKYSPSLGNCKRCVPTPLTCPSTTCPWRVPHPVLAGGGYPIQSWTGGTQSRMYPSPGCSPLPLPYLRYGSSHWGYLLQKGHGTSGSILGWR